MIIFEFNDYRSFLKNYIETRPQKGRGVMTQMAAHLHVHSTLISLILSGKRHLTLEQACELIDFVDLTEEEGDYFLLLVEHERAGTAKLRRKIQSQIKKRKEALSAVSAQIKNKKILSEKDQSQFYSHWLYSGIRLFCSVSDQGQTLQAICTRFDISRSKALLILDFLTTTGLVVLQNNHYKMGPQKTYVGPESPFLVRHHANWRIQSLQKMGDVSAEEMMVTSPFSISRKDFIKIKSLLLDFIKESSSVIQQTEPEDIACFNLDLFWVGAHKDSL